MSNEMPNFEKKQTFEVEGAKEIIENLDSIIAPIEELKKMVLKMQEMQAGADDQLRGQFSEQNIEWINSFMEKIKESSSENIRLLKFFIGSNFDAMEENYNEKK